MTGSAADWQLRRLPPLCLVCSEPLEVLPGGALSVSPPLSQPPPSQPPTSALPPPPALGPRRRSSAWSPELREKEVAAAAAAASSEGCDSLTGAIDGRRRGFHGGIYLWRDRTAAIKKREREAHAGGLERAASRHLPSARCLEQHRAQSADPSPTLPRSPPPLNPPARPRGTLAGLFREGVKAVGLSMETGTLFDPVEEEDLLFSNSE